MVELNYKSHGQGEPVIVLHGLFGMLDNWQTVGKKLAEHHTVYLLDQRNHGRSPQHERMTYADMAEDLHHFMESHWMFKAHIIGHSMGGKTAMQFARQYPDMVDKLVVVDIAPKAYRGGHERIFKALQELDLSQLERRSDADKALADHIDELSIRQFLLKNLSRRKEGGYRWKMNLEALWNHYEDILAEPSDGKVFQGDALFIRGGRSRYIRDEDWPLIQQQFPNARLATVEEAGHWVHAAAPDELLRLVTDFFKT
jgi:esterase